MTRMTDHIGRVLGGRYRLLTPLGAGASAHVYLADDVRLRRRVAVKVLHAALADDASFLRRFRAEAQAAASLSHPHIVAVYDWSGDDDTPFLVTEYLSGGSLRSILDAGHRLTPAQALVVGLEAARALALLLIEAVTGRVPFSADTTIGTLMARLERSVDVPDELGPLAPIIADAGKIDAGDRIDAATFGARLVAAAEHLARPAPLPLVRSVTAPGFGNGSGAARRDSTLLRPVGSAVVGAGAPVPLAFMGTPHGVDATEVGGGTGVGPAGRIDPGPGNGAIFLAGAGTVAAHRGSPNIMPPPLEPARGLHTRMAERPRRRRAPLVRPTVARRSQRPPSLARRRGGRGRDHAGRGGLLGLHDLAGAVARGARRVDRGPGGRGQRAGGWLRLEDRRREELLRGHRRGRGRRHHARARHRSARGRAHHVDGFAGTAAGVGTARPGGVDPR